MEQVHTVNRLHEELREVRSKMATTTESTFASERQLGQLEEAVRHEQAARRRAEQDAASAQGQPFPDRARCAPPAHGRDPCRWWVRGMGGQTSASGWGSR
jgi:hypothetical protein